MLRRSHLAFFAVLGTVASLLFVTPTAQSADRPVFYYGVAGGSQVRALGTTISSDLTGSSSVSGFTAPKSDTNQVNATKVRGVLTLGAIATFARSSNVAGGGKKIVTGGKTADVNVLNGLITAKAVETKATAVYTPDGNRSNAQTEFVNLKILGETIPVNVKKNTTISIPGVAIIVLNGQQTRPYGGGVVTQGFGAWIKLLDNRGRLAVGAEILLNPTTSSVAPGTPNDVPVVGGLGYGTNVRANVADLAQLDVSPTAVIITPMVGTNGEVQRNTTVSTDVEGVLSTGTVITTAFASTSQRRSYSRMTQQTQGVNILNGLVTADAVKVSSIAERVAPDTKVKKTMSMSFVNLKILGTEIPVDVSPNTKITVNSGGLLGLGDKPIAEITINKRVKNAVGSAIIGVEIKLLSDRGALKTGAIVELAVASTLIYV